LVGELHEGNIPNGKSAGKVKVMSTELKADYDKIQLNVASIHCTIPNDNHVFLVFSKDKDGNRKKFQPFHKTAAK